VNRGAIKRGFTVVEKLLGVKPQSLTH
jgi:hypothetical protein